MRTVLLGAAALFAAATIPASAHAQRLGESGFTGTTTGGHAAVRNRGFGRDDRGRGEWRRDRDRARDRRDRFGRSDFYLPYRDYQGDTLWRPDSFNDWWHERPQRAYPAWMARNKNCERMWWSGGDWRC